MGVDVAVALLSLHRKNFLLTRLLLLPAFTDHKQLKNGFD